MFGSFLLLCLFSLLSLFQVSSQVFTPALLVLLGVQLSYFSPLPIVGGAGFLDPLSSSMGVLLSLLTAFCLFLSSNSARKISILLTFGVCLGFFLSKSVCLLFLLFEVSVFPLFFLISSEGNYPERVGASLLLVLYTLIFSSPLFIFSLSVESEGGVIFMSFKESGSWVFLALLGFLVKLPLYLLHSWLPRAHVEAPLEGSILLAGVMLKMGFYGIVRFLSSCKDMWEVHSLQAVSAFGCVISFLLALSSDDLKKSVAYSSIAHMNFSLCSFVFLSEKILFASWLSILAHGLCASLLFWGVSVVSGSSHSRSILVSKGVLAGQASVQVTYFLIWVMNFSPPPFFSFLGELGGVTNLLVGLGGLGGLVSLLFIFLGSFFSVYNYLIVCHSPSKLQSKSVGAILLYLGGGVFTCMLALELFFMPHTLLPLSGCMASPLLPTLTS